jgi:hypothetical protein
LEYEDGRITGYGFGLRTAPIPFALDASTGRPKPGDQLV